MSFSVPLDWEGLTEPLWHATGKNEGAASARSSKSMISANPDDADGLSVCRRNRFMTALRIRKDDCCRSAGFPNYSDLLVAPLHRELRRWGPTIHFPSNSDAPIGVFLDAVRHQGRVALSLPRFSGLCFTGLPILCIRFLGTVVVGQEHVQSRAAPSPSLASRMPCRFGRGPGSTPADPCVSSVPGLLEQPPLCACAAQRTTAAVGRPIEFPFDGTSGREERA